jgi:hypothetical protein
MEKVDGEEETTGKLKWCQLPAVQLLHCMRKTENNSEIAWAFGESSLQKDNSVIPEEQ